MFMWEILQGGVPLVSLSGQVRSRSLDSSCMRLSRESYTQGWPCTHRHHSFRVMTIRHEHTNASPSSIFSGSNNINRPHSPRASSPPSSQRVEASTRRRTSLGMSVDTLRPHGVTIYNTVTSRSWGELVGEKRNTRTVVLYSNYWSIHWKTFSKSRIIIISLILIICLTSFYWILYFLVLLQWGVWHSFALVN